MASRQATKAPTTTRHQPGARSFWMIVKDRKRLATLMLIREASHRDIAQAAGWRSHTYVGRLLRGEAKTLTPDAATRIARFLGVPVEDLFLLRTDSASSQPGHPSGTLMRIAA